MERSKGRNVIVTGASAGIGRACAGLFALRGDNVVINYNRSRDAALELAGRLASEGANVIAVKADVSREFEAVSLVKSCVDAFGAPDVLVNNAGIALPQKLITETTWYEFERLFSVNAGGCFNCSKAVLPYMINKKSGAIVNISSVWGVAGASCEVAYSASKAAVAGFTKALAKEVGPSGIRVNCVAPGVIDTVMNSHLTKDDLRALADETALCRIGTPEDIAETVSFLASDAASFITGQVITADGGFI